MSSWIPGMPGIPGGKVLEDKFKKHFSQETPKFGVGNTKNEEENCLEIQAFISCFGVGGLNVDLRRLILPKSATVIDAKESYIKNTKNKRLHQDLIGDENYFIFGDDELKRPLYTYSNNCKLNLSFFYSDHFMKPFTGSSTPTIINNKVDSNNTIASDTKS